ncbi:MAG: NAD(P)H-dependent oxidoreductase [Holosporaceae bacterium]
MHTSLNRFRKGIWVEGLSYLLCVAMPWYGCGMRKYFMTVTFLVLFCQGEWLHADAAQPLRVAILFGSYRPNTNGKRVVRFIEKQLEPHNVAVEVISAADLKLPLLQGVYEADKESAPSWMHALYKRLIRFDAFILVSGVYNRLPQPGLLTMINYFFTAYQNKPAGLVSYSVSSLGGVRIEGPLRMSLATLEMVMIPKMLSFPKVTQTFDAQGTPLQEGDRSAKRTQSFIASLLWYAKALRWARAKDAQDEAAK